MFSQRAWKRFVFGSCLGIALGCSTTPTSSLPQCSPECGAQQYCQHSTLPGACSSDAGVACQPGCPGCPPFVDTPTCMPMPTCTDTTTCECLVGTCSCTGQCGADNGEYELQCNGC